MIGKKNIPSRSQNTIVKKNQLRGKSSPPIQKAVKTSPWISSGAPRKAAPPWPSLGKSAKAAPPWPSLGKSASPNESNSEVKMDRAVVGGVGAALRNASRETILNQGVSSATKSGVPAGYYQGPSGKWFRPNGQFASNVEVGLPAPMKPISSGKGGRLGSPAVRTEISEIGDYIESIGGKVTGGGGRFPEEYLPGPKGSTKGSNYLDITAEVDGKTVRINTVDVKADGKTLTKRELDAAEAIFKKTGQEIITIPKGSGLGDLPDRFKPVTGTPGSAANAVKTVDTAADAVKASTVANATTDIAGDALKSGSRSGLGTVARVGGKALGVVGAAMDAKELYDSYQADGGKIGENTVTSAGGIAGSWGGAAIGAKAGAIGGAAIGSVIPVVGTAVGGVIGGILGGIVGGIGGNWFGKKVANTAYNGINGDK